MVFCTKCGTLNSDDATVCSNCGAPLEAAAPAETGTYRANWRWERDYYRHHRGGLYPLVFNGAIIAVAGLISLLAANYNINVPWGAIFLIFLGMVIIAAGVRARRVWRRRQ